MLIKFLCQKGPLASSFFSASLYAAATSIIEQPELKTILTWEQWDAIWLTSLAFYFIILGCLENNFLLITRRYSVWKWFNGPLDDETLEKIRSAVLYENQEISIDEKLAIGLIILFALWATAVFIRLVFL